jgi:iron uptake system EfeUOB component EfeO/EfeM
VWALALLALLTVGLFAGSALTPGGSSERAQPFAKPELAAASKPNPLAGRLSKVYGTNKPASRYGTEVADLEDSGTNLAGEKISELSPLPARAFTAPENEYRRYAQRWISLALGGAAELERALAAGDRAGAQRAWETTWSDYLHLGAVYGLFGQLDQVIDGTPGGLPDGSSDAHFIGLHKLEQGLWSGAAPRSLLRYDTRLQRDLARLHDTVMHVQITPLEYATRSHEIVEDAQRDLLSGTDVPASQQGVLGTAAGVAATEEVVHTLAPLLSGRENTEGEVRSELLLLSGVLHSIRRRHGGRYPSLTQMPLDEREQLNGYVAGALSALEQLPGTLETEAHVATPRLPSGR